MQAVLSNPWRRIAVTFGAVVVVFLIAATYRFFESHGLFTTVNPTAPGICRAVEGVAGVVDIALDSPVDTAFLAVSASVPSPRDGLYAYSYNQPGARPVRLLGQPKDFHPIAVSLYRAPDGNSFVRTIFRHASGDIAIALFRMRDGGVEEIGRMTADVLNDPADLVSVDQDRFYLINRHKSRTALGRWLDDTFLLPRANILYFDGMKFVPVAEQLNSPAGLALSPDGSHLYISEDYSRSLVSFTRSDFTGTLDNPTVLAIPSGLQKLNMARDGSLWLAAQPKAFKVDSLRRGTAKSAPTQVFRVNVMGGMPQSASLVYADKGSQISAANIAAQADGHLIIGSALDSKLLDCAMP